MWAPKQYQKKSVPDVHATEQDPPSRTGTSRPTMPLLCGIGKRIGATGRFIMSTLATAMRAAHVADFYMTKYASKAQEALGPIMQPFAACMRRIVAAETTLIQRARLRICRSIFRANRTMWFSACELGVFLATGASCVYTENVTKVFSGKGIAMMHECKRMLNHNTSDQGLLCASRASTCSAGSGTVPLLQSTADAKGPRCTKGNKGSERQLPPCWWCAVDWGLESNSVDFCVECRNPVCELHMSGDYRRCIICVSRGFPHPQGLDVVNVHAPSGKPKLTDPQRYHLIKNMLQSSSKTRPNKRIGEGRFLFGGDMNTQSDL